MRLNPTPFILFPLVILSAYLLGGPTAAGIAAGACAILTLVAN